MKIQIFICIVAFFALTSGVFVPPRPGHKKLLGAKECSWGPSYWCKNLTSAATCRATKHCIQTVWIYKQLPVDNSSVCQTCLDMVKEARDQLESNETQELIKQVFEGSCALLHFKEIVRECDKVVDQFIPELIETLASEMDPQVVCSVAGLCNNERVFELIAEEKGNKNPSKGDTCNGCHTVVGIMEDKFNRMSKDELLQSFLEICRKTGSLSDACSNIIVTYYTEIYNHLKENFNANDVCLMSGECSARFHTHANVEITPISHIGYVPVGEKDDLPCEFCEQLVNHLRDLLVANTTEEEFKQVLEGLCKQTRSFKDECLSLVDEYYAAAYNFLVSELNSNAVCVMAGICPSNKTSEQVSINPLLPVESAQKALEITPAPKPLIRINMAKDGSSVRVLETPEEAQLPIDLLVPPHTQVLYNSEVCVFCEYFLHYVQQVLTDPTSEEEIKKVIDEACSKLPRSINSTCVQFVDMYEPALIAILAQEIDPTQVCPLIKACPASDVKDVEIFMHQKGDNSKCPLCLFAVSKLEEMIKDKKTEADIKEALSKLCSHLSQNLAEECNDFVNTYTDELVEMLIADLTPQEVCVYLKLCTDDEPAHNNHIGGDIRTNLIADNTVNGKPLETSLEASNSECVICEFVMKEVQDQLKDNKTEENIKRVVHNVCNALPRTIGKECNDFVNQYADMVIQLLIEATVPSEICRMMHLCPGEFVKVKVEIFDCAVCEALVYAMEKILANPKVDHNIEHVLEKACRALPRKEQNKCTDIINKYGKTIYDLIIHLADKGLICKEVGLCAKRVSRPNRLLLLGSEREFRSKRETRLGAEKCTWGPSYWCASDENAAACGEGAKKHCQEKVWLAQSRPKRATTDGPPGSNQCTWGPGFWCASDENAEKCGPGAKKHCQEKVWLAESRPKRATTDGPPGSNQCTWGPGFWCASDENAEKCGPGAKKHCQEKVWLAQSRPKRATTDGPPGSNQCTWGPGFWCASDENAEKCGPGAKKHCQEKVWLAESRPKRATTDGPPGSNQCTWGPGFWCASDENAEKCGPGAKKHCQEKVWLAQSRPKRATTDGPPGSNQCTWGPGFWCASDENAEKCGPGAKKHCQEKVWLAQSRPKRATTDGPPGSNQCTWGPGFWCASDENAEKCGPGAKKHCQEKVWLAESRPKRDVLVGSNRCTWGPSYWCASDENAAACGEGAKKHCQEKVWLAQSRPKRDVAVGSNRCTWGPSYWCASNANAAECGEGAKKHCQEKVWLGSSLP